MLNELLIVERGARQAGLEMAPCHPDIKDVRSVPTLLVRLDEQGHVASVRPVHRDLTPWTLRDGQHNSFPFVQPKSVLLDISLEEIRRQTGNDRKNPDRRAALLALADATPLNLATLKSWTGAGLLYRLGERLEQLRSLEGTDAAALPATIDRFRLACYASRGNQPGELLREVVRHLRAELETTAESHWLDVAAALLLGKQDPKTRVFMSEGALLFDAEGPWKSVSDRGLIALVSAAIRAAEARTGHARSGRCALSGEDGPLAGGKFRFPQPNLPVLGQTFLFARNSETPANSRYGRSAADTMPVSQEMVVRLAAAAALLTAEERRGMTWRAIPGEAPKQSDLLLAFVDAAPEAPLVDTLAEDDFSVEVPDKDTDPAISVAAFEKRTERLMDAIRARVPRDFTTTPVRLAVLRKVDEANRKVIYSGEVPVREYHRAAREWAEGERNVPPWLELPVFLKGQQTPRMVEPPHVAPLGVIAFSRQLFLRGGTEKREVAGVPASEAMALFLEVNDQRAKRFLRLVLERRTALVSGAAHAQRRGKVAAKKGFDHREVLRTTTLMGVLLYKLSHHVEGARGNYMSDTAFKLGQLLAAADVVHAGYCADVRGGDLPPSLLGNQVFAMAQTAPVKALESLGRRWRPYEGWVQRAGHTSGRVETLRKPATQRDWDVRKALRNAREMRPLAAEIAATLPEIRVNDVFRAELLLGYLAGLPKAQRDEADETDSPADLS